MRSNFIPERFTQDHDVLCMFPVWGVSRREPQIQSVKEVDPRTFYGIGATGRGAEVNCAAEDSLERIDHTSIVRAIDGKFKFTQNLGGRLEGYGSTLLFHG
jgi:hypothetical protein